MQTIEKATQRQTWAIFCITGWDVRGCELDKATASTLIDHLKAGKAFVPGDWDGARQVRKAKPKEDWKALYDRAAAAGSAALAAKVPTPMVVAEHESPLDDSSPIKQQWYVAGGA